MCVLTNIMKKSLAKYKEESPEIPGHTCPYIDFIQEILKEIKDEADSEFVTKKVDLLDSTLEYVRDSNDSLRRSSSYWYNKFVSIYNKK